MSDESLDDAEGGERRIERWSESEGLDACENHRAGLFLGSSKTDACAEENDDGCSVASDTGCDDGSRARGDLADAFAGQNHGGVLSRTPHDHPTLVAKQVHGEPVSPPG